MKEIFKVIWLESKEKAIIKKGKDYNIIDPTIKLDAIQDANKELIALIPKFMDEIRDRLKMPYKTEVKR